MRLIVKIDNMPFRFMAERRMTDAIFSSLSATEEIPGKEERSVDGFC